MIFLLFFISFGHLLQQRWSKMIQRKRVMKREMEMEMVVSGGQLLLCLLWGELFSRCSEAKPGRAGGELGQKDVSDWRFGGLLPGLHLDFDELHTSDVFGSSTAISYDTMGRHRVRWCGPERSMASGCEKKTIDSGNYSLHMWLSDADYVLMRKNDSLLTFTHFHMDC